MASRCHPVARQDRVVMLVMISSHHEARDRSNTSFRYRRRRISRLFLTACPQGRLPVTPASTPLERCPTTIRWRSELRCLMSHKPCNASRQLELRSKSSCLQTMITVYLIHVAISSACQPICHSLQGGTARKMQVVIRRPSGKPWRWPSTYRRLVCTTNFCGP